MLDYTQLFQPNWASYAPAVSDTFLVSMWFDKRTGNTPFFGEELNFTNPKNNFFYYNHLLASAGQSIAFRRFFKERDRTTSHLIGDSGGFQVQGGSIKFKGDETCQRHLEWLETNCDDFLGLDFPTGGINRGTVAPHIERLRAEGNNLEDWCHHIGCDPQDEQQLSFAVCLLQSIKNNDYFVKHRNGNGNMLSALQGRNLAESNLWYEHVKYLPCDGYAMAGNHIGNLEMLLTRLVTLHKDGLLKKRIHVLGTGRLDCACVYSTIQQEMQAYCPGLTITYDSSCSCTCAGKQRAMVGYTLRPNRWSLITVKAKLNDYDYTEGGVKSNYNFLTELKKKSKADHFVESEIGKQLMMKDVCALGMRGGIMDFIGYNYLQNHNLQVLIEATLHAQRTYEGSPGRLLPHDIAVLRELIPAILRSSNPLAEITRYRAQLNVLSNHQPVADHSCFKMPPMVRKTTKTKVMVAMPSQMYDVFM